jgi:hypothetical protein
VPNALSWRGRLDDDIARNYRQKTMREDVEVPPELTIERALPERGMQARSEYVMHAHFELLHRLVGHADKIRLFLDLDSGIPGACLSAFVDEIRALRCDAFYVRHGLRSRRRDDQFGLRTRRCRP